MFRPFLVEQQELIQFYCHGLTQIQKTLQNLLFLPLLQTVLLKNQKRLQKAGNGKILPVAVQRGQPVVLAGDKPAGFIKDGLHGKLVMLKEKILLGGSVVGVFRVDMLECCQPRHLLS